MNWNFVFKLIPYILLFTNKLMRKILFSSFFFIFFYMKNWINILISPLFIPSSSSSSWIKPQQNIIDYIHINSKNYVNIKAKGIWKGTHNGHPRSLNLDQRNGCESFDQRACEFFFFFFFSLILVEYDGILWHARYSHVVAKLACRQETSYNPLASQLSLSLYIYFSYSTSLYPAFYVYIHVHKHTRVLSIYLPAKTNYWGSSYIYKYHL